MSHYALSNVYLNFNLNVKKLILVYAEINFNIDNVKNIINSSL